MTIKWKWTERKQERLLVEECSIIAKEVEYMTKSWKMS